VGRHLRGAGFVTKAFSFSTPPNGPHDIRQAAKRKEVRVGLRYIQSKQEFRSISGPINIVSEDEYGYSQNSILLYPNVNSCTTITVMFEDDQVFGAHLTVGTPTAIAEALLNKINASRGNQNIAQLHVVGVIEASGSGWKSEAKYSGPNLYKTLNETFGRGKATPVFLHKQKFKQVGGNYFHYKVICGQGALGWYSKETRDKYPQASISEGFQPLQLQAV
jgi:hypothetical protein